MRGNLYMKSICMRFGMKWVDVRSYLRTQTRIPYRNVQKYVRRGKKERDVTLGISRIPFESLTKCTGTPFFMSWYVRRPA